MNEKFYTLSFTNIGVTLPVGLHEKIFDSMVSVRMNHETTDPHLGLGLYIVKLIAKKHGGFASAENLPDSSGVKVMISIPKIG